MPSGPRWLCEMVKTGARLSHEHYDVADRPLQPGQRAVESGGGARRRNPREPGRMPGPRRRRLRPHSRPGDRRRGRHAAQSLARLRPAAAPGCESRRCAGRDGEQDGETRGSSKRPSKNSARPAKSSRPCRKTNRPCAGCTPRKCSERRSRHSTRSSRGSSAPSTERGPICGR